MGKVTKGDHSTQSCTALDQYVQKWQLHALPKHHQQTTWAARLGTVPAYRP